MVTIFVVITVVVVLAIVSFVTGLVVMTMMMKTMMAMTITVKELCRALSFANDSAACYRSNTQIQTPRKSHAGSCIG